MTAAKQTKDGAKADNVAAIAEETTKTAKTPVAPPKFKITKHVTLGQLKLSINKPAFVKITAAMYEGKKVENSKYDGLPTIMEVIDLMTGQPMETVVNTVLASTFDEEYPEAGYVGKTFQITKLPKVGEKKYHPFEVLEIELEG